MGRDTNLKRSILVILAVIVLFLTTGAIIYDHEIPSVDGTYDLGTDSTRWRHVYADGFTGDGSALTGIAAGTGGVINTGSTTIGADSDDNGSGEIALQIGGVTKLTVTNSGNIAITGTITSGTWNGTAIDISDYTNLVAGTNITLAGDTLNVDDAFLLNSTNDTMAGILTVDGLVITTTNSMVVGTTRWDDGSDAINGEVIADDTIDGDALDFTDITLADFTVDIASTDLTDTADLLYEAELNSFAELQAQIADKTLVNEEDATTIDSVWTFATGITSDVTGDLTGNVTGNVTGDLSGNAATATILATTRDFSISGDMTAAAQSFNGSTNIDLSTTLTVGVIVNEDVNDSAAIDADKLTDGSTNAIVTLTQETNWDAHLSDDGSAHSLIDQDVTSGSSPVFDNTNMTGNISVWTNDSNFITSADVPDHKDLTGLQGGTTDEYYHLTSSEWTELSGWIDDIILNPDGTFSGTLTADDLDITGSGTFGGNVTIGDTSGTLLLKGLAGGARGGRIGWYTDNSVSIDAYTFLEGRLGGYKLVFDDFVQGGTAGIHENAWIDCNDGSAMFAGDGITTSPYGRFVIDASGNVTSVGDYDSTGDITLGANGAGSSFVVYGASAGKFMSWSSDSDNLYISGGFTATDGIATSGVIEIQNDGEIYVSGDDLYIKNTTSDKDIILSINDGGTPRTITWDADVDKLKHSAGTFDFDDDNIETTGTVTGDSFVTGGNIGISGDVDLLQLAANTLTVNGAVTATGTIQAEQLTSTDDLDVTDVATVGHIQADNFTTDEVTNHTVFVGDDSGGSGTNSVHVGEHAGENDTSSYGAGVGNYVLQNNTGTNPVANGFSTGQDNTGDYLTSGGYAAAQRNKGHRLTVSGGFAGQENLGNDATLGGYLAGQYNTENNATSTGGNAGQWNTGENPTFIGGNTGRWGNSDNPTSVGYNSFNLWTDDTPAAETFDNTDIDDVNDRITITTHGFGANNSYLNLMYDEGTSSIPGLTDGVIYQWKVITANIIELRIGNITGQGTGTGHTFTPKVCYANSSAFGYDAEPDAANQVMLGDLNVTQVKTAGTFIGTGLTLGDNEPIELGEGDGAGGDLGCDGKIYSDGNDLVIQVESPTGASADYTNPSMTIKSFDVFDGAGLYVPVISFPRHGGVGVIDHFLYVRDTSGGTADPSIILSKGDDVTRFLSLTYNTVGAYGGISTAVVNDLRLGDGDDSVSVAHRLRVGSNVAPTCTLDVTGDVEIVGTTKIYNGNELRFYDTGDSNYVGFEAPALTADQIWVLPAADGSADEILTTNGSGTLSFTRMAKAIYAELSDSNDQTFAVAGTAYSITFNTNDEISGITHSAVSNTENITIVTTGVYTIFAQPQVAAAAGGAGVFHMWLQRDAGGGFADVANTNIELSLASLEEDVIPLATTFSLDSGDVIRLRASVSDTKIKLDAQTPAGEPVIPSIIFTMFMIGT